MADTAPLRPELGRHRARATNRRAVGPPVRTRSVWLSPVALGQSSPTSFAQDPVASISGVTAATTASVTAAHSVLHKHGQTTGPSTHQSFGPDMLARSEPIPVSVFTRGSPPLFPSLSGKSHTSTISRQLDCIVPRNDELLFCAPSRSPVLWSTPSLLRSFPDGHPQDHRIRPTVSRIVLWPSAYLPAFGGVEELTRHLALALVAAGDDVEVWTGTDQSTDSPTVETIDGLVVRRFPLPLPTKNLSSLARLPLGTLGTIRDMRGAVKTFRPDLFHIQCFGPNGVYAALLSRLTGRPLVLTLQGETVMDDHDVFEQSQVLRSGLRSALRQAAAVTGCSQFTLADAEARFGLRPGRGRVIFNGVDLALAPPEATSAPPLVAKSRYVFAVGRVVEKKGFDLLLDAFSSIAPSHPDVDLMIGGDGAALPSLRELAGKLDIADRVRFPGRLSRLQVATSMAEAEIVVMPSRLEPFGIVVLEAWRAGRPVVATSKGGPKEFIEDGEDGLLVDPFDRASLAEALDGLLADTVRSSRMGAAGRQSVREFDWPVVAGHYRSLYAEVLSR